MGMLSSIWYGKEEPPHRNMMWAKPVDGGFTFYIFDGKWKPQKTMNDKSTAYTGDDEVLPLENAEINEPYTNVYIGIGETAEDVLLPVNLYESVKKGFTISFTNASGYIYALSKSERLPKLSMGNHYIPANTDAATIDGVTYHVLKSENSYEGSFAVEVN